MSKQLDWLAEEVLATFAVLGFDAPYIVDKRDTLAGKDRFAVLVCLNNLDAGCREALANRLGIPLDDLGTTIKTLARLGGVGSIPKKPETTPSEFLEIPWIVCKIPPKP